MKKPVRIFRHIDCEGPGYLLEVLARHDLQYELIRIDQGDELPLSIDDVSALVFMGGSMSVNDDFPWIIQELDIIRRAIVVNLPVLGHCLGGQLIAKALGAQVSSNRVREVGWFDVKKVGPSEWTTDLPDEFLVYHWHGEMFSLPDGAELLLANVHCPHQGFAVGSSLALQCHIEMTQPMVREWAERFADQLKTTSDSEQNQAQMLDCLEQRVSGLNKIADKIYMRWLEPVLNNA